MTKNYTDHASTQAFIEKMDQAASNATRWKKERKCQGCGGTDWRCKDPGYVGTVCSSCLTRIGKQIAAELEAGRHLSY